MTNQPILYMLVGLPGSGKSTYSEINLEPALQLAGDFFYYSTDHYIDAMAVRMNTTYDDLPFAHYIKAAERFMNTELQRALLKKQNVIWDQTNLTVNSRRKKLARFPIEYRKIAVVFEVPEDVLNERLVNRPGKTIPAHVIKSMRDSYEPPTLDEGFDAIEFYQPNSEN